MPTFDILTSSNTLIDVSWIALVTGTQTGGSSVSIDNYEIQWDQGSITSVFVTLNTAPSTTFSVTTATNGVTGGETYQFKVRAINIFGPGDWSPILSVVAAQAPSQPIAPTVTQSTVYVTIAWTAPTANNAGIDKYQVLIGTSTGTYVEDTTKCDGSDSVIAGQ